MQTLLYSTNGTADAEHLPEELATLKRLLLHNGFTRPEVEQVIASHGKWKPVQLDDEIIKGVVVIPYYSTMTNLLSQLLLHHRGKTILRPQIMIKQMLRSMQEPLGLQVPGLSKIPCPCGVYYIGQNV